MYFSSEDGQNLKFENQSIFIVSDGFDNMRGITDSYQAIIAGMGGEEIIKILSKNENTKNIKSFILQPQKNVVNLREYLINNGYKIVDDVVVKDGSQFYCILKCVLGKDALSYEELHFGRTNLQQYTQDFVDYLYYQKNLYDQILKLATNFGEDKQQYYNALMKCIKRGESKC
jgi:tRNA (adenine22-N1)-methyltransferase